MTKTEKIRGKQEEIKQRKTVQKIPCSLDLIPPIMNLV